MNIFVKCFFVFTLISLGAQFHAHGKKLGSGKMLAVSLGIVMEPHLMVTAWEAKEEALKVLAQVELYKKVVPAKVATSDICVEALPVNTPKNNASSEQTKVLEKDTLLFVQKYRDQLVTPIDSFLAPFRNMGVIIIPLIKESLGQNSMLERLFKTDSSISVKAFFEKEVQSVDKLESMGTEFVTFFNDLEESLSTPAKNKYKEALAKKVKPSASLKKA